MILLMHPFVPHLSEELWESFGSKEMAICQSWPKISGLAMKKNYKLAIQINGKTKQIIDINDEKGDDKVKEMAISNEKIKKIIANKDIKRVVYVPKKILNIVI